MKKKFIVVAAAIVVVAIIVTVFIIAGRGVSPKISDDDLSNRMLYNNITNLTNSKYEKEVGVADKKQEALPTKKSEVEKQLEFDLAICALCEEKGIPVTKYDAEQISKVEFEALKENNQTYYNILSGVLNELEITEEDYSKMLVFEAYCKYNEYKLKNDFQHIEYDENADEDLDTQFKEYVKDNMAFSLFS